MATFGDITSSQPNILFNPMAVDAALQGQQRNQLLMQQSREQSANRQEDRRIEQVTRDRTVGAQFAGSLNAMPAAERPAAYASGIREFQAQGLLRNSPTEYPGDHTLQRVMLGGMTVTAQQTLIDRRANTEAMAAMLGGASAEGATPAATGSGTYLGALRQQESGGDPNARNPRSTATGPDQFIEGTWMNFAAARPDLFQGMSRPEVLAARTNPAISQQATEWYASENGRNLASGGLPNTPATTALAHGFGAEGAAQILRANPMTTMAQVVSADVMRANPNLAGQTAGQVIAGFERRFANVSPSPSATDRPAGDQFAGPGAQTPAAVPGNVSTNSVLHGLPPEDIATLRMLQTSEGATPATIISMAQAMRQRTATAAQTTIANNRADEAVRRQDERNRITDERARITDNRAQDTFDRQNPTGPLRGDATNNQLINILLTGDASSPEYAAAFAHIGREDIAPSGMSVRQDMTPFRTPTYAPPGQGGAVAPVAAAAPMGSPQPPADVVAPLDAPQSPTGAVSPQPPGGAAPGAAVPPAVAPTVPPAAGAEPAGFPAGGRNYGRSQVERGTAQPTAADRSHLRLIEVEASGIDQALTAFVELRRTATSGERVASAAGLPTALSTSYANAALLAKGVALYNLGVLNGPDLSIIRRALADPGTLGGMAASQETVVAQADQIRTLLNQRIAAARVHYGGQAPVPAAPGAGATGAPAAAGAAPSGWSIRPSGS